MDRISPNFIYAFVLTRSGLGLIPVIFQEFVTELWSLMDGFYSMKSAAAEL